jgi:hypothetical protein
MLLEQEFVLEKLEKYWSLSPTTELEESLHYICNMTQTNTHTHPQTHELSEKYAKVRKRLSTILLRV